MVKGEEMKSKICNVCNGEIIQVNDQLFKCDCFVKLCVTINDDVHTIKAKIVEDRNLSQEVRGLKDKLKITRQRYEKK